MDLLFVVFSCDDEHWAGIRVMSEPRARPRYGSGKLQHKRRFAAATIPTDDGHRPVGDHIPHDPWPRRRIAPRE
jgi:hypothetical protein